MIENTTNIAKYFKWISVYCSTHDEIICLLMFFWARLLFPILICAFYFKVYIQLECTVCTNSWTPEQILCVFPLFFFFSFFSVLYFICMYSSKSFPILAYLKCSLHTFRFFLTVFSPIFKA